MKRYTLLARTNKPFIFCALFLMFNSHAYTISSATNPFPIVKGRLEPSKHERVLITELRDINSSQEQFRIAANKLTERLVDKVYEELNTVVVEIDSPVAHCQGEVLDDSIEFVSVMRSGDALLHGFSKYFPLASINKVLVQRNEETAEPIFKYKKLSSTICQAKTVIITEPMIATGGSLTMVIDLLKKQGIEEKNIIVASICAAPEGLLRLSKQYPELRVVVIMIDDHLNEKFYISPGIGDFGDRYFGT